MTPRCAKFTSPSPPEVPEHTLTPVFARKEPQRSPCPYRPPGRTLPTTSAAVRSSDADISLPKKNRSSPSNGGSSSLDRFKSGPRRAFPNPLAVCTGRRYTSPSYGAPRERRLPDRAGLPRARHLPARQLMRAREGIRLEARNFRLLIEEESKCLHHHRLIQGQPFAP